MGVELKECMELVNLVFRILEERTDAYYEAKSYLDSLRKAQSGITPEDLIEKDTIEKLSNFLSSWNRSRRYDEERLKRALNDYLKKHGSLILEGEDLTSLLQYNRNGKNEGEKIGTAKLLHIINPSEYPLIDNPIAQELWRKSISSMEASEFVKFYNKFRKCTKNFIEQRELTFKQLDELLYILYTKQKKDELYEVFRKCNNSCEDLIENLIKELEKELKETLKNTN